MAKYIDADKLTIDLQHRCDVVCPYTKAQRDAMCRACLLGCAIDTVEDQPAADVAPRWIPVTERLPEKEGQYLVCCNGNYPIEVGGFYIDEDGERYFGCDWNDPDDIEAWMPLPEPYKRGEWKNE